MRLTPFHRTREFAGEVAPIGALLGVLLAATGSPVPALAAPLRAHAAPPEGFVVESIGGEWDGVVGATFLEDGRAIAWERTGRLWMIDADGSRGAAPMLDLSDEVGAYVDHGMLGVAADPNYLVNGRIYLLYVVDRHHLLNAGTPGYDPQVSWPNQATIGRLTRYSATPRSNFTEIDPSSRSVLLGESITTGIPIVDQSHGVGSLVFGEDHTLLVSVGDNASYWELDQGGPTTLGHVEQALADGILAPKEDVGAWRSQLVDCLCGKILRLDPSTGNGVPSNPWYDAKAPRSARSRVWCLGLRNPFRMTIVPESGEHDPAAGDPGTLVVGDVGWSVREEVNVAETSGINFGWPLFESLGWTEYYATSTDSAANPDAPNPLFGSSPAACAHPSFAFRDLLVDDTTDSTPLFANPCALFQAENAFLSGPTATTAHAGFTGTGWIEFHDADAEFVQWTVPVAESGDHTVHFRYALGVSGDRPLRITVDGVEVASALSFPSIGSWEHAAWSTLTIPLAAGVRQIRATTIGRSGPNLDALALTAPGAEPIAVPASIPRFVHRRPVIGWLHRAPLAYVPGFAGPLPVPVANLVGTPESGTTGAPFQGSAAIGGAIVESEAWPEEWNGVQLFGDYTGQWIRGVRFGPGGAVTEVSVFDPLAGPVVFADFNHHDDALWVVRWGDQLLRIRYDPDLNQPPEIVAVAAPSYGPSPLETTLDASGSSDPEGTALEFIWTFPDGSKPARGASVTHTFESRAPARHDVLLTVRDADGIESSTLVPVWTDNTPPAVEITSVSDGDLYSMEGASIVPLEADIADAEQSDLSCEWVATLHHNAHTHPGPTDASCATSTIVEPLGCGEETYFYDVTLTVTDPLGLSTTQVVLLYPDCEGVLLCPADLDDDGTVGGGDFSIVLGDWGQTGEDLAADLNHDHVVDGADVTVILGHWGPCR